MKRFLSSTLLSNIVAHLKEIRMPSDKRIVAYLEDEDYELWKKAVKKYKLDKSKLLKEIVHSWLFSIKLQLKDEND
jgi:hypothetical protein